MSVVEAGKMASTAGGAVFLRAVARALVMAVAACASPAPAADGGDSGLRLGLAVYREASLAMRRAEKLAEMGRGEEAFRVYKNLYQTLVRLREKYPRWNNAVTRRKIAACRRRMDNLARRFPRSKAAASRPAVAGEELVRRAKAIEEEEIRTRERQATGEEAGRKGHAGKPAFIAYAAGPESRAVPDRLPDAETSLRKARQLWLHGRGGEAMLILEEALVAHPDTAELYLERGDFFLRKKKYELAGKDYSTAISLGEGGIRSHFGLGTVYEKQAEEMETSGAPVKAKERFRDAVAEYKECLWRDHTYAPAYYGLGCVYSRLGMREDALYYFRKTLERAKRGSDLARRASYNTRLLGGQ